MMGQEKMHLTLNIQNQIFYCFVVCVVNDIIFGQYISRLVAKETYKCI